MNLGRNIESSYLLRMIFSFYSCLMCSSWFFSHSHFMWSLIQSMEIDWRLTRLCVIANVARETYRIKNHRIKAWTVFFSLSANRNSYVDRVRKMLIRSHRMRANVFSYKPERSHNKPLPKRKQHFIGENISLILSKTHLHFNFFVQCFASFD